MVGHIDEIRGGLAADELDELQDLSAVGIIEPVARLVQDHEKRRLDHGPGQEDEALLPVREMVEPLACHVFHFQKSEPLPDGPVLFLCAALVEPYGVKEPRADHIVSRDALLIPHLEFRRNRAELFLDLPDGLPASLSPAEEMDVIGIPLDIVARDQLQKL